jgi:hypothetical protein
MKKLLVSIAVVLFLVCASDAAQPKISLDRLNWTQSLPEDANITLDGGFVKSFQSEWTFNPVAYGATGDDYSDDAEAIQDCIDAAYAFYQATLIEPTVEFPPGRFFANTSQTHYDNYGILIEPRPHIKYKGAGFDKTILRAKDNYRNASVGCYLFWNEDEYFPTFELSDIGFEYGNNTVQIGENNYTAVGASWIAKALVHDLEFKNVSGTWALLLGASDVHRADCSGARVYNIYVENVAQSISGDQTHDHTSIRFNMDDVLFSNSILRNDGRTTNAAGFEFHGNNSIASNIFVKGYDWGVHLGADQDSVSISSGQVVRDCIFRTDSGVGIWSFPSGSNLKDLLLTGNKIYITEDNNAKRGAGFATNIVTGTASNISIVENYVENVAGGDGVQSAGAYLGDIDSLIFRDNEIRNCTNGIKVENTEDISFYDISENDIIDWGRGIANGQHTAGIYVDIRPSVDGGSCTIRDNNLLGDGWPEYGILTYTPNLKNLNILDNYVEDSATADIVTFIPGGYTDEKTFIRHTSRTGAPSASYQYAISGSTWQDLVTGKVYRRAVDSTSWKEVNWTYV